MPLTNEDLRVMIDKRMGRDVMDYEQASFSLRKLADEIYDRACEDCAKACEDQHDFWTETGADMGRGRGLAEAADIARNLKHRD